VSALTNRRYRPGRPAGSPYRSSSWPRYLKRSGWSCTWELSRGAASKAPIAPGQPERSAYPKSPALKAATSAISRQRRLRLSSRSVASS
jgi:hypothetical protein